MRLTFTAYNNYNRPHLCMYVAILHFLAYSSAQYIADRSYVFPANLQPIKSSKFYSSKSMI